MARLHSYIFILLITCLQVGCISPNTCIVDVKSTMKDRTGIVYVLETENQKSYAKQVDIVLQRNGFVPVCQSGQTIPEISIRLDAELYGPFRKTYTYSQPVFRQRTNCCSCPPRHCTCSGYRNQTFYEIVDSIKRTGSYEAYSRTLALIATDLRTGKNAWETTTTSTGKTGDLDAVFPVLLLACEPFIATNTKKSTRVLKKLNNDAVVALTAVTKEN